jgi:hypothetical protein
MCEAVQQAEQPQQEETNSYTLTIEVQMTVPAVAKEVQAFDGRVVGFELPGGIIIKPEVTFEQTILGKDGKEDSDPIDISWDALTDLGVDYDNITREFVQEL